VPRCQRHDRALSYTAPICQAARAMPIAAAPHRRSPPRASAGNFTQGDIRLQQKHAPRGALLPLHTEARAAGVGDPRVWFERAGMGLNFDHSGTEKPERPGDAAKPPAGAHVRRRDLRHSARILARRRLSVSLSG